MVARRTLEKELKAEKICAKQHTSRSKVLRVPRDFLVAIGGWKNDGPTDIVELMDVNQECWRRIRYMEGKRKIAYHGCVVVGESIYVLGGYEGTAYFNKMFCLNIKTGVWKECAPMQYNRCYVAACEFQGKVFAAGGADNLNLPRLKTAEMYDVEKNQWVRISDMTRSRSDAAACVMRGKVYVVGGFDGFRVLQTVDVYDPEVNLWIEFAHLQSPRSGLACAVDEDCILIFGGYDGAICASSGELLRLGSAHTTELPSLPAPRANFDVCKLGKYFYAVGGWDRDGLYKDTVFRFDRHQWEKINGLRVARCSAKLVVLKAYPNPLSVLDM
ncbi:unnamed protein product [Enterobius vermicularis]|uniref:Kelch-like protein 10 n=1 Tax=Enterobius vermicularis TaxID=51028 RepID=A0A0N4UX54_ENTVE|nr:unnamed protein product [Enterobius vermicularis]